LTYTYVVLIFGLFAVASTYFFFDFKKQRPQRTVRKNSQGRATAQTKGNESASQSSFLKTNEIEENIKHNEQQRIIQMDLDSYMDQKTEF